MIEHDSMQGVLLLDEDRELSLLVVRLEVLGRANVALAVRAVLEELPMLVPVAGGRPDVARALDDERSAGPTSSR
jgi:hypothetical protein